MCENNSLKKSDYLELWKFQSNLMWSRIKTTSTIVAAILTGSFYMSEKRWYLLINLILLFGSIFLFIMSILMHRDSQFMKMCKMKINSDTMGFENLDEFPKIEPLLKKWSGRRIAIYTPIISIYFIYSILYLNFILKSLTSCNSYLCCNILLMNIILSVNIIITVFIVNRINKNR